METLTIEIKTARARKLIDDLVDLGVISLKSAEPTWNDLWEKLDHQLPQTEPDITQAEITAEINAYRREKQAATQQ